MPPAVRKAAFETLLGTYGKLQNTLASTLSATVKAHVFMAQVRHFPSSLEAALFDDQVPVAVYDGLIGATHDALPLFHRYLDLRKRTLGLPDLDMYDLYAPLVPSCAEKVPMAQAREWVIEACRPLGADYGEALRTAFSSRWIDWPENKGKRSGAYSSGCYDSPPYLLLNHHDRLDDAFTLAHELGHSLHTWMANRAQPHRTAHYPIFLAEIASTVNELLLTHHLLGQEQGAASARTC
jgi:oligoendopeptidase F